MATGTALKTRDGQRFESGESFATLRFARLAITHRCPLIEAAHNDPRFEPPPATRRFVEPLPTLRMTDAELDEILWGTL